MGRGRGRTVPLLVGTVPLLVWMSYPSTEEGQRHTGPRTWMGRVEGVVTSRRTEYRTWKTCLGGLISPLEQSDLGS